MLGASDPVNSLPLLIIALVAAALAGVILALEFFGNKILARRAPGLFAAILASGAVVSALIGGPPWLAMGFGGLASLVLLVWPISFDGARERLLALVSAKSAWIIVLGLSLVASRYFASQVLKSLDEKEPAAAVDLEDVPILSTQAVTDKGRSVQLFHFKVHSTAAEAERFIRADEKELSQFIRLCEANPTANCHGWVFTSGQYGIRDPEIAGILSDNAYTETAEPREGDLAIYSIDNHITHSGVVRIVNKQGPVLVESKWGPFGVYLHAVEQQPFPGKCKFYRSSRRDHLLVLRSPPSENAVGSRQGDSRSGSGQLFAVGGVSRGNIEVERGELSAARILDLVRIAPLDP
jgi:hypothetical protein